MADLPTWLGGVGQAVEALIVLVGAMVAAKKVDRFLEQRELALDQTRASAAADIWDTVVKATDVVGSLFVQPIRVAVPPHVEPLLEARLALIRPALEGINRSIGRSILLIGDADIHGELRLLSEMLYGIAKQIEALPTVIDSPVHVVSDEQHNASEAAFNTILRKLNGVALRRKALPKV